MKKIIGIGALAFIFGIGAASAQAHYERQCRYVYNPYGRVVQQCVYVPVYRDRRYEDRRQNDRWEDRRWEDRRWRRRHHRNGVQFGIRIGH